MEVIVKKKPLQIGASVLLCNKCYKHVNMEYVRKNNYQVYLVFIKHYF